MTVKELIKALSELNPDAKVVGYCEYSEDDFLIEKVEQVTTDKYGIPFYNQAQSCMYEQPGETVVVLR